MKRALEARIGERRGSNQYATKGPENFPEALPTGTETRAYVAEKAHPTEKSQACSGWLTRR